MKILTLAILFLLTGCSSFSQFSTQDKLALQTAVTKCLVEKARELDDGFSPADSVAIGVAAACSFQIDSYDETRVEGAGSIYKNTFYKNRHIGWHKSATLAVLNNRASK